MGEKEELLAEIHRLVDEQGKMLREKLTPEMARDYRVRDKRIKELLEKIRNDPGKK